MDIIARMETSANEIPNLLFPPKRIDLLAMRILRRRF